MTIPAQDITEFEKGENLTEANVSEENSIVVVSSNYPEAKRISRDNLGYSISVEGQASENNYQYVTPEGLLKTTATTSRVGLTEHSTDTEAINKETPPDNKALVCSNVPPIFAAYFDVSNTYDQTDVDVGKTNVTVSNLAVDELKVGKMIKHFCNATIVVAGTIPYVQIGLNSDNLPKNTRSGYGTWFKASEGNVPLGIILTVDSGKLAIEMIEASGNDFAAGTYEFTFQYEFLIS